MKLLKPESCLWESGGGNVNIQTALGDALVFWSSDRGSTPLGSITHRRQLYYKADAYILGVFHLEIQACKACIWT